MRLTISQVLVLWSVVAGVMVLVFFFGLYAGREQGLEAALEEYRQFGARIPIANPQAISDARSNSSTPSAGAVSSSGQPQAMAALNASPMIPSSELALLESSGKLPAGSAKTTAAAGPANTGSSATGASGNKAELFDFTEEGKMSKPQAVKENAAQPAKAAELELFKEQNSKAQEAAAKKAAAAQEKEETAARVKAAKESEKAAAETAKAKATDAKLADGRSAEKAAEKTAPEPAAGWYVQVAATRDQSQASDVVDQSRRQGFTTVIEVASVRDSRYYRVLIGPYETRELALNAKSETKRKSLSRTEPFLKRIK